MPCWFARCLLLVTIVWVSPPSSRCASRVVEKFHNLLEAIDKVVSYSVAHYKEMNFDEVFRLWIVKGYLNHLLSNYALWHDFQGKSMLNSTKAILARMKNTVEEAIPEIIRSVKERDPSSFERMGGLLNLQWIPHTTHDLFHNYEALPSNFTNSERFSDVCLRQLLLSNNLKSRCQPSENCIDILLRKPLHGYALTRQIFYVIVIFELNCTFEITNRMEDLGFNFFSLTQSFCSTAFDELLFLSKLNSLNEEQRDLLLEQIFVCSHLGYLRFNSLSLLDMILSWQHPSGCFSDQSEPKPERIVEGKLSEDHGISDGCLPHMTSRATVTLLGFLRKFFLLSIETDSLNKNFYRALVNNERFNGNTFIPKLLEPPKIEQSPIDFPWVPSVRYENFKELSRVHRIAPCHAAGKSTSSAFTDAFFIIDVDMRNRIVFYCLLFFSLVLCLVFCLRMRRYFHVVKFNHS